MEPPLPQNPFPPGGGPRITRPAALRGAGREGEAFAPRAPRPRAPRPAAGPWPETFGALVDCANTIGDKKRYSRSAGKDFLIRPPGYKSKCFVNYWCAMYNSDSNESIHETHRRHHDDTEGSQF